MIKPIERVHLESFKICLRIMDTISVTEKYI